MSNHEHVVEVRAYVVEWPTDAEAAMETLLETLPTLGALGAVVWGGPPDVAGARFNLLGTLSDAAALRTALDIFSRAARQAGLRLGKALRIELVDPSREFEEVE